MDINIKSAINILSALLTPTIALLTAFIAYQQWQTNERKRKQDLFELRYENIYKNVKIFLDAVEIPITTNDDFVIKYQKMTQNLFKYRFLIKQNDFNRLNSLIYDFFVRCVEFEKFNAKVKIQEQSNHFEELEKIRHEINMLMFNYLQIEQPSIFEKTKDWVTAKWQKISQRVSTIPKNGKIHKEPLGKVNTVSAKDAESPAGL